MKGFSPRNPKYMRAFAQAWSEAAFVQEVLAQLPWYHQLVLLDKLKTADEHRWYAAQAIAHDCSRNALAMQIETNARTRASQAVADFAQRLASTAIGPGPRVIEGPYRFDFLGLHDDRRGARWKTQRRRILHRPAVLSPQLRCYVVIELKSSKFNPEHMGQRGFHLSVVDRQVKSEHDSPTIGPLLGTSTNKVMAEHLLRRRRAGHAPPGQHRCAAEGDERSRHARWCPRRKRPAASQRRPEGEGRICDPCPVCTAHDPRRRQSLAP
ncbi:MAG: DUF1016 family protein [Rhodanobacteraceae bacterium]|nr:DUF1016 family protein [Rhodanobacteraceae bacterium]